MKKRNREGIARVGAYGLLAALLASAAGCSSTAARVGDKFVDLYFVEADQAGARPLAVGLAEKKLDDELKLVSEVRKGVNADEAKPTVFYTRRSLRVDGERANATYDLTIKFGADETKRNAMLSMERQAGAWRVANYLIAEGHLPASR